MNTQCFVPAEWNALAGLAQAAALPSFDYALLERQHVEAHVVALRDQRIAARCSCWVRSAPPYPPERPGVLGHFAAADETAAAAVLQAAQDFLRRSGCSLGIGPMDGNTWRRYRWITERGAEPPFFMEPDNPPDYPVWWERAGFAPLALYQSALITELTGADERLERVRARLAAAGVVIRPVELTALERDLRHIHAVSLTSFAHNFLYTPLSAADFLAQYLPYRAQLRPEFILLAMRGESCVGFVFCIPDFLRPKSGQPLDTLILKTLAILPGRDYAGLGNLLIESVHRTAHAAGMQRVIHALSAAHNPVINITARYGNVRRRYTLYARRLSA
jgi:hypothetical protein